MPLQPPEWRDGSLFLYLGKQSFIVSAHDTYTQFCIRTLKEKFAATVGDAIEGPGTTIWSVHIAGMEFSLILDEDYGDVHLVSSDRSDTQEFRCRWKSEVDQRIPTKLTGLNSTVEITPVALRKLIATKLPSSEYGLGQSKNASNSKFVLNPSSI